jgi:hypothetical protein
MGLVALSYSPLTAMLPQRGFFLSHTAAVGNLWSRSCGGRAVARLRERLECAALCGWS